MRHDFKSWLASLSIGDDDTDRYPEDILLTDDPKLLCSCLCRYVMETRKENGEKYPLKSLFNLLSGLLRLVRYMRENKTNAFNIFDDNDANFLPLKNVMDSYFRQLHGESIEANTHQSEIVSAEEDLLWVRGVIWEFKTQSNCFTQFFITVD